MSQAMAAASASNLARDNARRNASFEYYSQGFGVPLPSQIAAARAPEPDKDNTSGGATMR